MSKSKKEVSIVLDGKVGYTAVVNPTTAAKVIALIEREEPQGYEQIRNA